MAVFPSSLTEEEESLQRKYAKLKKKVMLMLTATTPSQMGLLHNVTSIIMTLKQAPVCNSFIAPPPVLLSLLQKKALLALKKQSSTSQTNQSGLKRSKCVCPHQSKEWFNFTYC